VSLSEGRLSHLSQTLLKAVVDGKLGTVRSDHHFLTEAKKALTEEFSLDVDLDRMARARMPKHVLPGSRDWDVRYRQYYEEERRKLGR
jgi:hypothetical protein